MGTQQDVDAYHAHLDVCERCESRPFDLCTTGRLLLERTAPAPKMDWEKATPGPIGDVVRELTEFQRFAKAHPNSRIHVKRWNRTLRGYEFGFVHVREGVVDPVVFVSCEEEPPAKFPFENVTTMVIAGWIGD